MTMKDIRMMAALLMAGGMMVACSSDGDDLAQTDAPKFYKVTVEGAQKGGDEMRGLLADAGTTISATWDKVNDKVWARNASQNEYASGELTPSANDATATLSGTLSFTTTPAVDEEIQLYTFDNATVSIYNMDLYDGQKGTLADIGKNYDFCRGDATVTSVDGGNVTISLGTKKFVPKYAILKLTLVDKADGTTLLSPTALKVEISGFGSTDLTEIPAATYVTNGAGVLYVAVRGAVSSKNVTLTATCADGTYTCTASSKSFTEGKFYSITAQMEKQPVNLANLTANYEAKNGDVLTGTLANNVKITIAAPVAPATTTTITLKDADINGSGTWTASDYAGLTPQGNATIILEGSNKVTGFSAKYPGIFAAVGSTLTIQGTGSLTATGGTQGCGIGGCGWGNCGNIVIAGGNITAVGGDYAAGIGSGACAACGTISITGGTVTATGGTGTNGDGTGIGAGNGGGTVGESQSECGNISITGGTVTATGNKNGAGIGGGWNSKCGTITIGSGVTSVTATKGDDASSIGAGNNGTCGTVTIEDASKVTQN